MFSRPIFVVTFVLPVWLVPFALGGACPAAEWNGHQRLDFNVGGRECVLVAPGKPAVGRPWIWRTEFFGLAPQADVALLDKGFHVACIDIQNMYGAPVALRHMDAFYANLVKQHGLAPKTVLEGFSRGALSALNWATKNPEKVAAIYVRIDGLPGDDWPTNQTVVHLANVHADCLDSVLRAASADVAATLLSNLGHTVVLRVVLAALRQAVRRPACRVRP